MRPVYLLTLGYMMAYWGGFELKLKKRLALLKEVSALSNPRFGVDRTLGMIMERVLAFYNAASCLLITVRLDSGEHHIRRADGRNPEAGARAESIDTELARRMTALPPGHAVVYNGERRWWRRLHKNYYAFDVAKGSRSDEGRKESRMLANLLDAKSFVTIRLEFRGEIAGWFYVIARRPQAFDPSDADFLLQIFDNVFPVLDNIRLVDRLASDAAEAERQRIARNIHDSVIQPYLGLQIGLTTVRQRLAESVSGETGSSRQLAETVATMVGRIERLIEMTNAGINDLRRYVSGLKETGEREENLLSAVRRFAAKFEEATGIAVEVEAVSDFTLNDRLAAEAFQMVAEGLSNIRRHTRSRRARIELARRTDLLILRIENDLEDGSTLAFFTPRSISERAESLGGHVQVEQSEGRTIVTIQIPL